MVRVKNLLFRWVVSLPFVGFYVIVTSQEIICDDSCPCNSTTFASNQGVGWLPALNCSGVGVNSVSVCGSLKRFSHVDFSYNDLVTFPDNVRVCEEVEGMGDCLVDLSHNKITNFNLSYKNHGAGFSVIIIDLSFNRLSTLGRLIEFTFTGVIQTVNITVNVSHNLISYVQEGVFTFHLPSPFISAQVLVLDLSYNNIAILYSSFLASNTPFRVRGISLQLQHNEITSFNISSYLNNLNRSISRLSVFVVNLGDNLLTGFKQTDLTDFSGLYMNLHGNPWNCDCQQRWIANGSAPLRIVLDRTGSIPQPWEYYLAGGTSMVQPFCKSPPSVEQHPLLSLFEDDFICPPEEDTSVLRTFHPSKGDTVKLFCPVTQGDPPIEIVKWRISLGVGSRQSFLSLKTSANSSLTINNMNQDWQGSYICTVDNGVEVSFALTVNLSEDGLPTTSRADDEVSSVLAPPHVKGRPLTGVVIVFSFLLIIATFGIVAVRFMNRRSQKDKSENSGIVRSKLTENRLRMMDTPNTSTVQQLPTESQRPSTTENTRRKVREPKEILYENDQHPGRTRGQPGRDVHKKTGSAIVSVKYDDDMSVYYNVSTPTKPRTDGSNDLYDVTNGIEYTDLNIHEITRPTSAAYQSIICQPEVTSNENKFKRGKRS